MDTIKLTIPLEPVSKKNSQQIRRRGRAGTPFISQSDDYKNYERQAMTLIRIGMPGIQPIDYPVTVSAIFYRSSRRRIDLTNLLEAIDDVLVRAGILEDDCCTIIVSHDGSRVRYDRYNPRTEVTITAGGEPWND